MVTTIDFEFESRPDNIDKLPTLIVKKKCANQTTKWSQDQPCCGEARSSLLWRGIHEDQCSHGHSIGNTNEK